MTANWLTPGKLPFVADGSDDAGCLAVGGGRGGKMTVDSAAPYALYSAPPKMMRM